jgi:hypothetical protein
MVGIQQHPQLVVRLMIELKRSVENVGSGRRAVRRWNNVNLYSCDAKKIEILFGCESIVAGNDEEAVVAQARDIPRKRTGFTLEQTHAV